MTSQIDNANSREDTTALSEMNEENRANGTWTRMLQGNKRFAQGTSEHPWQDAETRRSLLQGQNPQAAILTCSDSRVPAEIIFDQGLGDLFTVRTAGATIDQAGLESLEYAVDHLHVSIIVVLTHQGCSILQEAAASVQKDDAVSQDPQDTAAAASIGTDKATSSMPFTMEQALKTIEIAHKAEITNPNDIERIHISMQIERLVDQSEVIRQALSQEKLKIIGARYVMTNGLVEVLSF